MEQRKKPTAIVMIALGACINLCLGAVYSFSVFRIPLEQALNIPSSVSGYPYMVFLAVFALTMPFAGYLLERMGPRITAMAGGLLVAAGWILAGYSGSIVQTTLFYGVLGGIGVGVTYGVPLSLAARWFPDRTGLAAGIALLGFGMSPFITAPLAGLIISEMGVLAAFRILGIAFGVLILLCSLPMRLPDTDSSHSDTRTGIASMEMLRSPRFWGLWICFTLGTVVGLTAIGITSPVGQVFVGLNAGTAATAISVMALCNGIGRPLFGSLADSIGIRRSAQTAFGLIAVAAVLMLLVGRIDQSMIIVRAMLFVVGFALLWLVLGGWLAIAPSATTQLFGRRFYSRNYGFVYTAYGAGAVIGTVLSGAAYDLFGGYNMVFAGMLALGLLGLVVSVRLLPSPRSQSA